jgi:anion-transporting  ArsA/GET3 family ATPase
VEVDPRENLHRLLGIAPSGGDVVRVSPRLHLQHLDPRKVLDDVVRDRLKIGALVNRVLSSPIHQHFAEGAPGLKETAVLGRVERLMAGQVPRGVPRPDVVVLDAPATGHGVSLLRAPQLVADVIQSGPVGHMAGEIAAMVADPARCGVVLVTAAEEMPVQESLELLAGLDEHLGLRPEAVVVNGLYPSLVRAAHDMGTPEDPALELWARRRAINEREMARLRASWTGPLVTVPLLPVDPGPSLVEAVVEHLRRGGDAW